MLMSYVPEAARARVIAVTVQEVVAAIKASGRHGWIAEFEEKYGLVKPTPP